MLLEAENSEEFKQMESYVKMFTNEKGAQTISPLDALNSASQARETGWRAIRSDPVCAGLD